MSSTEIASETFASLGESLLASSSDTNNSHNKSNHQSSSSSSHPAASAPPLPPTYTDVLIVQPQQQNAQPLEATTLSAAERRRRRRRQQQHQQQNGRILDRGGAFFQSRGRWGIHRTQTQGLRRRFRWDIRYCWQDWFHSLAHKPTYLLVIILFMVYAALVVAFAEIYYAITMAFGEITENADGTEDDNFCHLDIASHTDALYFSLSTMTTIGYGASDYYFGNCMTPFLLVLWQSCTAITFQSVAIGILFLRISRGQKRSKTICFSDKAVVRRVRGQAYLMFRVAEMRRNCLMEVSVRCFCIRHERYASAVTGGMETYHFLTRPMKLLQHEILMSLPQVLVHPLNASSPLAPKSHEFLGFDDETNRFKMDCKDDMLDFLADREAEIIVLVEGTDELTGAAVQARQSYRWEDVEWDATFVPCVKPWRGGSIQLMRNGNDDDSDVGDDDSGSRDCWCRQRRPPSELLPSAEVDFSKFHEIMPASPDCQTCPYIPESE